MPKSFVMSVHPVFKTLQKGRMEGVKWLKVPLNLRHWVKKLHHEFETDSTCAFAIGTKEQRLH